MKANVDSQYTYILATFYSRNKKKLIISLEHFLIYICTVNYYRYTKVQLQCIGPTVIAKNFLFVYFSVRNNYRVSMGDTGGHDSI